MWIVIGTCEEGEVVVAARGQLFLQRPKNGAPVKKEKLNLPVSPPPPEALVGDQTRDPDGAPRP
jgi:hypothetical protein